METILTFQTDIIDGATIWSNADLTFDVHSNMFDPNWINENTQVQGHGSGRGQALIFRHHNETLVYRHYRRGGLFGRIVKDLYLGRVPNNSRAYKELSLLSSMRKLQLPVPRPIAARFRPFGIAYKADIIIAEIPNSQTFSILPPD